MHGKCDRVVFTPVTTPMFTPETLRSLLRCNAPVVRPSVGGRGGHPILLSDGVIDEIVRYQGADGLRGALRLLAERTDWVEVADEGILSANPHPTEAEVRVGVSGNLCRCTGYNAIINAIMNAAKEGNGLW